MLILEVIMVKDGTMNLVIGIWEKKRKIANTNEKEKRPN
jgi:hypothetical protein